MRRRIWAIAVTLACALGACAGDPDRGAPTSGTAAPPKAAVAIAPAPDPPPKPLGPSFRLSIAEDVLDVENTGDGAVEVHQVCIGRSLDDLAVCFPTEVRLAAGARDSIPLPPLAELPGSRPDHLAVELHYAAGAARGRWEAMVPLPPARTP